MKRSYVWIVFMLAAGSPLLAAGIPADTTHPKKMTGDTSRPVSALPVRTDPQVGDLAPDFVLNDLNGKPVKLSDYRGKLVLLDFWRSSCAPCRREHPHLIALYEQYRSKGFEILSVSTDFETDKGKAAWIAAVEKDKLTWTQVWDPLDTSGKKYKSSVSLIKYSVSGLPRNFLIDPSGKVIARDLKGDPLTQKLKDVLGKS